MDRRRVVAFLMLKHAGLAGDTARGLIAAGKGFLGSGKHISKVMAEQGVRSPLAHAAAKVAPVAAAAGGAKAAWDSGPSQRLRYRYQMYKQRKAMKRAQRGY
jgi:hypothetical protein